MQLDGFDVVVVGAGFFGMTIAERVANELGRKVCVLDRRAHIGGNAYSEIDPDSGIEVHRYGTHIFHTNSEMVWRYLQRFTEFTSYRHRVFTVARGRLYAMPINLATISAAFDRAMTPQEAKLVIAAEADAMFTLMARALPEPGGQGDRLRRPHALRPSHPRLYAEAVADRAERALC